MFDFDSFREIFSTISKNKMRTALTGFAVAWGIFMLIILLAAGNGLRNGIVHNFSDRAVNTINIYAGRTTMPYAGLPTGRRIKFDYRDIEMLKRELPEIEYISSGSGSTMDISYGDEYISVYLESLTPDGAIINALSVEKGRFINEMDMRNKRKVIVLHPDHVKVLFKDEDPIGKFVTIKNLVYKVIGVYSAENIYDSEPDAYIPLSAASIVYNPRWGYRQIQFTVTDLHTVEDNKLFEERLREEMGKFHKFDPKDRSSLWIWNSYEQYLEILNVLKILNLFIIIIGLASLMAGIVGVSNIMLITVKERTREIGIRKSIGATRGSILWLIISESIVITTAAGYIGIVLGVGATELVSKYLFSQAAQGGPSMFLNPTVDLSVVFWATLLLVICGVIAGAIPAYRATQIPPIEAMRGD